MSATDTPEHTSLPGYFAFGAEDSLTEPESDPDEQLFSDRVYEFIANPGMQYDEEQVAAQLDNQDQERTVEDPELSIQYGLQRFPVDSNGDSTGPLGDAIVTDDYNRPQNDRYVVERQENPGGNDNAGVYVWTVGLGCRPATASSDLDPSAGNPILIDYEFQPQLVRTYRIHQLSSAESLTPTSSEPAADSDIDVTIEDEGANQSVTVGMGDSTDTDEFDEIARVWLSDEPEGDVTLESDNSSTTVMVITGGLSYSDDDQPVDGDRGVPPIGSGSRGSSPSGDFEYFRGDTLERPSSTDIASRTYSAGWTIEWDYGTDPVHTSRHPTNDPVGRTVTLEADVGGPFVSHEHMVDSLTADQADIVHTLDGGTLTFNGTYLSNVGNRTRDGEGNVVQLDVAWTATGDPAITASTS